MLEVLPLKILMDTDAPIFGALNVKLAKLNTQNIPVANEIVVCPPVLKLKTTLEHFEFASKEVFEQTLTLVKKEIEQTPIPPELLQELNQHKSDFLVDGLILKSHKAVWAKLLNTWLEEIKSQIWQNGFSTGLTANLAPQLVTFVKKITSRGLAFYDPILDDVVVNILLGKCAPAELKKIDEVVNLGNKKLLIPFVFEWIEDQGIKVVKIFPFTPNHLMPNGQLQSLEKKENLAVKKDKAKTTVKVFLNLSQGYSIEKQIDGAFIASEKIYDLNKPHDSFEELVFKLVEVAQSYPNSPVLMKLADLSEGMGKTRGALRLIHQKSLLDPLIEAALFARNKHNSGHLNPLFEV
jgi:hypothetical protein